MAVGGEEGDHAGLRTNLGSAAEERTQSADDDPDNAEDDEPDAFVTGRAGDRLRRVGGERGMGVDSGDQKNDSGNKEGCGKNSRHD